MSKRKHFTLSVDGPIAKRWSEIRGEGGHLTHNQMAAAMVNLWDVSDPALRREAIVKAGPPGTARNGRHMRRQPQ